MGFTNLRLPGVTLAGMYSSSLVVIGEPVILEPETTNADAIPRLRFLGNNAKKVCVLVHCPGEAYLQGQQLEFLSAVLKACGLTTRDIAIINTADQPVTLKLIAEQFLPSSVLLFGTQPALMLHNAIHFTITDVDEVLMMTAPDLETLNRSDAESRLLKSKLWLALKNLFRV